MRVILFVFALGAGLVGLVSLGSAKSVNQEIVGCLLLVMAAVFLSGAAVVDAVLQWRAEQNTRAQELRETVEAAAKEIVGELTSLTSAP